MGHRRRDVGLAEGLDDAARPGLRRRQRRAPAKCTSRPICARPIGTGPSARAPSTIANMPAPRRYICCSRCARRSTCCMPRDSTTSSCGIACSPKRCAARWRRGPRARCSASTSPKPNERSDTVTTVTMNGYDPAALQRYCKEKCGVVLGTGIGDLSGQAFRIAHMGHVNAPMILGTLGVIEVGAQCARTSRTARAGPRPRSNISARVWGREGHRGRPGEGRDPYPPLLIVTKTTSSIT